MFPVNCRAIKFEVYHYIQTRLPLFLFLPLLFHSLLICFPVRLVLPHVLIKLTAKISGGGQVGGRDKLIKDVTPESVYLLYQCNPPNALTGTQR